MTSRFSGKTHIATAMFGAAFMAPGLTCAAGFALIEHSASGMGNAYAGAAAVAEDASTIYFNPAGMTMLGRGNVVLAGHGVNPSIEFSNSASTPPTTPGFALGGNGGDAGELTFVPNAYASLGVSERLWLGIGVNVPFGFLTEYDSTWAGRFQAVRSEVTGINVNPAIAYKVNDRFSIGAGLSYQDFEAELTRKRVLGLGPAGEGSQELNADDTGWGWNIGALFNVSDDMRIGVSYRSTIDYELEGTAKVFLPTGALLTSFPVQADVEMPDTASLSVVQAFGPKWELLGDVTWTHWSTIDALRVVNTVTGTVAETLRLDFDDAWRLSFGVNYKHNDRWTFKGGVAWDQSPVEDATRTVNLPDNDRLWLSIGAKWRMSKSAALDVGYSHLFINDASIDQDLNDPATRGRVVGDYSGYVDILSAQVSFSF